MKNLEELGITLLEPILVDHYYNKLRGIFVLNLENIDNNLILDLDSLPLNPINVKEIVIKWLISINLNRLKQGEDPVITLQIVLKCPIWKFIKIPLKRITLTKEKLFNQPKIKTIGNKQKIGSINNKR